MIGHTIASLYDRTVQFFNQKTAIICGDTTYTYQEIGKNAASLGNALKKIGHKKGDRIAFLMSNCPEYIFSEYAVAKLGCIRVPLAMLLSSTDHVYMLNQSEAISLIYHQRMTDRVLAMAPNLETIKHFICVGPDANAVPTGHLYLNQLMIDYEPNWGEEIEIDPEDLAGIYYTGGTTGKPKGVMLSHRSWVYTILEELLEFQLSWNEIFAYATPLTHAGGCLILPVMLRGGQCVILDHFDPKLFLETVEKEKVTATFLVPTMIYLLLDYPGLRSYNLNSLKNIIYGASAIAPERLRQAVTIFGPILTQLFGQTEAPMMISCLSRDNHVVDDSERAKKIFGSAGRPTFHAEVRIVDDQGKSVAQGESGEVIVRCANVMSGYFKNPEATAEAIVDGWLHTGDIAKQDSEGFLYIVDRKKDMIVSGGFNIFPREIEDVLFEHPAVNAAAVVGIPHPKWGEEVKAVVVLNHGQEVTPEELIAFVKERKGSLMVPKTVEFWEKIPLTNLGKMDKKAIRVTFWEGRERMVS